MQIRPAKAEAPNSPIVYESVAYLEATPKIQLQSEVLYQDWVKIQQKPKLRTTAKITAKVTGASKNAGACSCVMWVKGQIGFTESVGNARNWPINSKTPQIGAVVVTRESKAGHVAIVKGIEGDNLILDEANYTHCRITKGRALPIDSKLIIGYYTYGF